MAVHSPESNCVQALVVSDAVLINIQLTSEKVHDLLTVYLLSEHFENPDIPLEQT